MKVGPFTAGFIAGLNWLFAVPPREIRFMNVIIDLPADEDG